MDYNEIYHHGIKGQKWGVRRYQNKDGSLTPAGKKRQRDDSPEAVTKRKAIAKKVAAGAVMTLTAAAAVTLYAKSPAARRVVNSMASKSVSALKKGAGKTISKGKAFVKGINEGRKLYRQANPKKTAAEKGQDFAMKALGKLKESKTTLGEKVGAGAKKAAGKAIETVMVGVTMNAVKRGMDATIGKAEAERIMKANNSKKIDSFWKVREEDDE